MQIAVRSQAAGEPPPGSRCALSISGIEAGRGKGRPPHTWYSALKADGRSLDVGLKPGHSEVSAGWLPSKGAQASSAASA